MKPLTVGALISIVSVLAAPACRSSGSVDPRVYGLSRRQAEAQPVGGDVVRATFLGAQGFLLERGADAILTAPLYSNPPLDDVLKDRPLRVDQARIDQLLPTEWVKGVGAILVGHSHYDHLMDVPYIARAKAPRAAIFGSDTMTRLIASAFPEGGRLRSVTSRVDYRMCPGLRTCGAANEGQPGEWIPALENPGAGSAVRIRALCSEHSPQYLGLTLWPGCAREDRPRLPSRPSEWMMGDTVAYLIDFLQNGRPVFRVYYQDSATNPKRGYVHPQLIEERPVDLALLCGGAFNQVRENPRGILESTGARHILVGHWDDFFEPQTEEVRSLPGHDFAVLIRSLAEATEAKPFDGVYWLPAPGAAFVFPVKP